jgi:hypothetical protein
LVVVEKAMETADVERQGSAAEEEHLPTEATRFSARLP